MTGARVLLLVAPFHSLNAPALTVSLLKSAFGEWGVRADVLYLNLRAGALLGADLYDRVAGNARSLVGDWLFSPLLFDVEPPDGPDYVRSIAGPRLGWSADTIEAVEALRGEARALVEAAVGTVVSGGYDVVLASADIAVGKDRIQSAPILACFRAIKAARPGVTTILGGAACQSVLGSALFEQFPFLDYVCPGEGEGALVELVQRVLDGGHEASVPGVLGPRRAQGLPAELSALPQITDLDALPYPDYSDFFQQREALAAPGDVDPILVFESSRGCWWGERHHCTFCGLNGAFMRFRAKSPRRALDELDFLTATYGVRTVFATDMILSPWYFDTFLAELAERSWPPSLFFEVKANLTKEQLRILARAGVRELQPGIESLSTPILRTMEKGVTVLQNVRTLKWCAEIGIRPFWNVLYGFPSETAGDYQRMAALVARLVHLAPPYRVIKIAMDRFSPNFDEAEARGFANVRPAGAYRAVYPLGEDVLSGLAFYFDYEYADGRDPEVYVRVLQEAVGAWESGHGAARLEMADGADGLVIEDARGELSTTTTLTGAQRLAYLALDAGATAREVERALSCDAGVDAPSAGTVERWLREWDEAGLVMREGARYLSLAVDPRQRVPRPAERLVAALRTAMPSE
ncbi:MAG: RiPP maturation radical SAM C-methyltransferase [Chloroflexota bacterium]